MLQLPNNWNQVDLETYLEMQSVDKDGFDLLVEQIAILAGVETEELDDLDSDDVLDHASKLNWLHRQPPKQLSNKINGMQLKDVTRITLGEFIDLENYVSRGDSGLQYVCAVMYRRTRQNEWADDVLEPYDYDIETRAAEYLSVPVTDVYGVLKYYTDFRDQVIETYKFLFEDPDWDKIEDVDQLDALERKEIEEEIEQEKKLARWGWLRMAYVLADGKLSEINYVLDQPLVLVLNLMAMKKELNI